VNHEKEVIPTEVIDIGFGKKGAQPPYPYF
jgi:hypothetical protein